VVWHVSLKRTLRVVGLVNRKEATNPRLIVRASTAVAWAGRKLVAYYVARFQIAFLCRDSKPFPGLAECQSRAATVLDFQFTAARATLKLARAEELQTPPAQLPHVFSMARWQQRQFNEPWLAVFLERVALDPTWVKNHPRYDELSTYGAIAA
jgi:hypothetical protein